MNKDILQRIKEIQVYVSKDNKKKTYSQNQKKLNIHNAGSLIKRLTFKI